MNKTARYFCWFLIFAFAVPFVLQRTIFPFYRFGMFAEPLTSHTQLELFWVEEGGKEFDSEEIGLLHSNWNQLMRNYHYRNEGEKLLQQTAKAVNRTGEWKLLRTEGKLKNKQLVFGDTVEVATLNSG